MITDVGQQNGQLSDIMGPLVDFSSARSDASFAVLPGLFPAGVVVPLHSHRDREALIVVSGELSVWLENEWRSVREGEMVDFAPSVPHALRNTQAAAAKTVLITTLDMADFLEEISLPAESADFAPERVERFLAASRERGYWNGGPDEQAAIGISVPKP